MTQKFSVLIEDSGETVLCETRDNVLRAMEALGRRGIPVGCRGGGCGVCKVQVLSGSYTKRVMSREYVSEQDEVKGCVLACRVRPTNEITLRVIGPMKKNVCRAVEPTDVPPLST